MGQRIDFTRARDKKWRRDKQALVAVIPAFRRSPPLRPPPPSKARLRDEADLAIRSFDLNRKLSIWPEEEERTGDTISSATP
jgi:hypothetical protein